MIQGGEGIRTSGAAVQGGTIEVSVDTGGSSVEVNPGGSGEVTSHEIGDDGTVSIPVPNVPPGTLLYISVGKGPRMQIVVVEVIAPPPV